MPNPILSRGCRLALAVFFAFAAPAFAQQKITIEEYIAQYAPVAQEHMKKAGIPASIILAQGIIESNYGNSGLARKANNHFGIKCHSGWTGGTYHQDDDAKDECFRKYRNALESFRDHSDFLRTRPRYAFLFEYKTTDYKSWAHGLKKAGYATNPRYPEILIRVIEERKLYQYDTNVAVPALASNQGKTSTSTSKKGSSKSTSAKKKKTKVAFGKQVSKSAAAAGVKRHNNIKYVDVKKGETLIDIANKHDVRLARLLKYNELPDGAEVAAGERIYLQPKRRKGADASVRVAAGESIYDISQKQGIKTKHLLRRNHLEKGEEPAAGEKLVTKRKNKTTPRLRNASDPQTVPAVAERSNSVVQPGNSTPRVAGAGPTGNPPRPAEEYEFIDFDETPVRKPAAPESGYHTVQAGETLYSISMQHYVPVERLIELNNLPTHNVKVGHKLRLSDKEALPAQQVATAKDQFVQHSVKQGETLFAISRQYGVTTDELMRWNNLSDPTISIGQVLQIKK